MQERSHAKLKAKKFSPQRKNRKKAVRSIIEGIILLLILVTIIQALLPSRGFLPVSEDQKIQTDQGFIAISYFGVDPTGDRTLISTKRLEEQLKALEASGYVTISQQDIIDYYNQGKPLPEKALFLIFEDGRRDTGIFAQKIMEKYNMQATMLTYANNLELKDAKFLTPKDLKTLVDSSFWGLGSNGYRLSYINVFDRYDSFLDQLDTYKFQLLSPYLDRNYNHYLMDYIRDESGISTETYQEMQDRIAWDYKSLQNIYIKELGTVPLMYTLMHSNTGQFGSNDRVSRENEKWIYDLFQMNFNREGDCLNTKGISLYDLTRIQPQSYWFTNHLLMRIKDDTKQEVAFVSGDEEKKAAWDTISGESEFIKDVIALTSLPGEAGLMRLKENPDSKNLEISVELKGNKAGTQSLYARANEDLSKYISVSIENNVFYIYERLPGEKQRTLFTLDLAVHDGIRPQSQEENKREAEIRELEARLKYATDVETAKKLNEQLRVKREEQTVSVADGAKKYVPEIGISEEGNRLMKVILENDHLSVFIDDRPAAEHIPVSVKEAGGICLAAAPVTDGYSQRNLADNVYDGVFKNLVISRPDRDDTETVIYDNRLAGTEKLADNIQRVWNSVINWFIKYL